VLWGGIEKKKRETANWGGGRVSTLTDWVLKGWSLKRDGHKGERVKGLLRRQSIQRKSWGVQKGLQLSKRRIIFQFGVAPVKRSGGLKERRLWVGR